MARKVVLAKTAGFCFGVKRAVEMATEALSQGPGPVWTLGPIIHNPQEVRRLEGMGLRMAGSLEEIREGTVVIRSHGAPRGVMEEALRKGLRVVDATCPFVKKVEERVRQLAEEGYQVVIVGDPEHPEVETLVSFAPGRCLVVGGRGEITREKVVEHKLGVVAQTTQSVEILQEVAKGCLEFSREVRVFRTNCHSTVRMRQEAKEIASRVDVMVVVGGKNSANTRRLAETVRTQGKPAHLIETPEEAASLSFPDGAVVGLTAGASTPPRVIEEVARTLAGGAPLKGNPSR